MHRDEEDESDRCAVHGRRAVLMTTAVAGLVLPLGAASCDDARPCLKVSVPAETTTASSSSAPESPSATPAPSGSASATVVPSDDSFSITKSDAEKLGLPGVGFRANLTKRRWSISPASKEQYVHASGPPGGPLGFLVKPYDDGTRDVLALEVLFRNALASWSGQEPIAVGAATTVTLGGEKLEAQSFRTGKSLATTVWCAVKKPASPTDRRGALFLFFHGANEGAAPPGCDKILAFEPLAEIARTVAFP